MEVKTSAVMCPLRTTQVRPPHHHDEITEDLRRQHAVRPPHDQISEDCIPVTVLELSPPRQIKYKPKKVKRHFI